jgi:hypothetical protein
MGITKSRVIQNSKNNRCSWPRSLARCMETDTSAIRLNAQFREREVKIPFAVSGVDSGSCVFRGPATAVTVASNLA